LSDSSSKSSLVAWLLFVGGGLLAALLTGRLTAQMVPDSVSYLEYSFGSLEAICRSIRTPGYPLWLLPFQKTIGIDFVPVGQVIVHATAVWWLFAELRSWDLPLAQRLVAAIAIGVGCTASDLIRVISTDALAASLGVVTVTAVLRWARLDDRPGTLLPIVLTGAAAIFVRPAYLFLIPWLLIAGAMLRRVKGASWRLAVGSSVKVTLLLALPVVGWMTLRLAVVHDFGIVPFGHQNLAGVLVQLVSDEELKQLDCELGAAVGEEIHRFDADVGFAPGAAGATMTIDARWDDMTYHVAVAAAKKTYGDDPVIYHRGIARLNREIVNRYPHRYAIWLVKAVRRGAWAIAADIVMHPVFLAAIGIAMLCVLRWAIGGCGAITLEQTDALRALTIAAWTYLIAKVGFVILTSPPIGRFSDAAAIFIPAWAAVIFVSLRQAR
jgi:uncharacterized membrane protein (Fun14 family)